MAGTIPSTLKTSFKTHCDPLREVLLSLLSAEEGSEVKPGSDKDGLRPQRGWLWSSCPSPRGVRQNSL